jgi:hypothetical protein
MIRRLVAAGAMIAAAVFLLLVARDTWHWSRAMRDGDARAALGSAPPQAWNAHTTLPAKWTRDLLGLNDDIEFRQTMVNTLFQSGSVPTAQEQRQRAVLESALVRISRSDTDTARASIAADTVGVLFYFDPPTPGSAQNPYQNQDAAGPSGALSPSDRALAEFQLAVRLDPNNTNAQKNLEILLRETRPEPTNRTPRTGQGDKFGTKGSGSQSPGHGY